MSLLYLTDSLSNLRIWWEDASKCTWVDDFIVSLLLVAISLAFVRDRLQCGRRYYFKADWILPVRSVNARFSIYRRPYLPWWFCIFSCKITRYVRSAYQILAVTIRDGIKQKEEGFFSPVTRMYSTKWFLRRSEVGILCRVLLECHD